MTAPLAIGTRSERPRHGGVPAIEDVKARLAGGTLTAALAAPLHSPAGTDSADSADPADRSDEIVRVRLQQEKHRRESASIVLDADVLPPGATVPTARSLVLHYPRAVLNGDLDWVRTGTCTRAARHWRGGTPRTPTFRLCS